jgi:hypothetical protein
MIDLLEELGDFFDFLYKFVLIMTALVITFGLIGLLLGPPIIWLFHNVYPYYLHLFHL